MLCLPISLINHSRRFIFFIASKNRLSVDYGGECTVRQKNVWTALQFVVLGVFLYILKYLQIAVIGPFSHF